MAAGLIVIALVGCSSSASPSATSVAEATTTPTARPTDTPKPAATATPELAPTPEPTPEPVATPEPTVASIYPKSYATLSSRDWARLVKAPDNYIGKGYKLWGCITQFDGATGAEAFLAYASFAKQDYWFSDGDNAMFSGSADGLAPFVEDDIVAMDVMSLGSLSYDTQIGGNTTVPSFLVMRIVTKGSCA